MRRKKKKKSDAFGEPRVEEHKEQYGCTGKRNLMEPKLILGVK